MFTEIDTAPEVIERNALLISSLPEEVAAVVAQRAAERYAGGGRAAEFSMDKLLQRVTRVRARLIARTEVSKASTALTEARSEELNLPWYLWRTSKDARVRPSHRLMENVLFRWSDPPSPEALYGISSTLGHYHAGNSPNDRCYPEVLLRLDQVSWPHKVYWDNTIRYMRLAEFRRLNHLPERQSRIGIAVAA